MVSEDRSSFEPISAQKWGPDPAEVQEQFIQPETQMLPPTRRGERPADRHISDLWSRDDRGPNNRLPRPKPRAELRVWAWILHLVIFAAGLWAVFAVFVDTTTGQVLEHMMWDAARIGWTSVHTVTAEVLAQLPTAVAVLAAISFILLTVWQRRWLATVLAVAAFALANLSTQVLKNYFLVRPYFENGVPYYTGNSLPSGHTTVAAASAIAIFLVVTPRWRGLVAFLGSTAAVCVGVSAFWESWHRPADMVAAFLVAGFWGLIAGFVIFKTGAGWNSFNVARSRPVRLGSPGWQGLMWIAAIGFLAIAAASFVITGGFNALPEVVVQGEEPSGWYAIMGTSIIAGTGFLIFALLASLFRAEAGRYTFRR